MLLIKYAWVLIAVLKAALWRCVKFQHILGADILNWCINEQRNDKTLKRSHLGFESWNQLLCYWQQTFCEVLYKTKTFLQNNNISKVTLDIPNKAYIAHSTCRSQPVLKVEGHMEQYWYIWIIVTESVEVKFIENLYIDSWPLDISQGHACDEFLKFKAWGFITKDFMCVVLRGVILYLCWGYITGGCRNPI